MSNWFHRNLLKSTARSISFSDVDIKNTPGSCIANELHNKREKLLELLGDTSLSAEAVSIAANQYLSLLSGLVYNPSGDGSESKLREKVLFRWTHSLISRLERVDEMKDSIFELTHMLINIALWYMKNAARISSNKDVSEEDAKVVHKNLRIASGIFRFLKEKCISKLGEASSGGIDTEVAVLEAYYYQCISETNEVVIARAVEKQLSASIIAALADDASKNFLSAMSALRMVESKYSTKWNHYLQFKRECYRAYAHIYHGESLLEQKEAANAICSLRQARQYYENASKLAMKYSKLHGVGEQVDLPKHLFFRRLLPLIDRIMAKCELENNLIYHQKVPSTMPELDCKSNYGLVDPVEFVMPEPHDLWREGYDGFECNDLKKSKKKNQASKPSPVIATERSSSNVKANDANTISGCVLS